MTQAELKSLAEFRNTTPINAQVGPKAPCAASPPLGVAISANLAGTHGTGNVVDLPPTLGMVSLAAARRSSTLHDSDRASLPWRQPSRA